MVTQGDKVAQRLLFESDTHTYYLPHPLLQPYIAHYTFMFPGVMLPATEVAIVPDASGCFVFFAGEDDEEHIWGPSTKLAKVGNSSAHCDLRLFVEFRPGALIRFSGVSQHEIADRVLSLDDLHKGELRHRVFSLMRGASSMCALLDGLDALFLDTLASSTEPPAALACAMAHLAAHHGLCRVEEVAHAACYSPRHLSRLFGEYLGMNLKTFARLLRVNTLLDAMKSSPLPLTHLAQTYGFYDQSHFIRDFAAIFGVAPGVYLQNLSGFYNESFKF